MLFLRIEVFENRVLKTIFSPKREKVTGIWRTFDIEKLYNFSYSVKSN